MVCSLLAFSFLVIFLLGQFISSIWLLLNHRWSKVDDLHSRLCNGILQDWRISGVLGVLPCHLVVGLSMRSKTPGLQLLILRRGALVMIFTEYRLLITKLGMICSVLDLLKFKNCTTCNDRSIFTTVLVIKWWGLLVSLLCLGRWLGFLTKARIHAVPCAVGRGWTSSWLVHVQGLKPPYFTVCRRTPSK